MKRKVLRQEHDNRKAVEPYTDPAEYYANYVTRDLDKTCYGKTPEEAMNKLALEVPVIKSLYTLKTPSEKDLKYAQAGEH